MAGNRNSRDSTAQIDEITSKELCGLPSSLRAYPAKGWLSIFTGTRRPYKYRIELRPDFKYHRSRESRSESESNSEFDPVSISSSRVSFRLPNFNLKTPLTTPSEGVVKSYVFVICPVVDCGHQPQPTASFPFSSFAEG
ncbi:hypothetical protein AVEN_155858-1 [Araneus ventricosus]|uniref:Uncharacterized protein n=1 Tax=Araneus ventricosus TaxID=182803 RepID=A0A4Y2MQ43_ARAVE|nr:hypothetical protein AVEN_155858-1 [Araneus ventricosus]